MKQALLDIIEKETERYRSEPHLALPQLEYMVARSLLDTLREAAAKEYLWTGEYANDEMLERIVEHDVEVDSRLGVYEAEAYCTEKRKALLAWSKTMSVKIAKKYGSPKEDIQAIVEMHENINKHPILQSKLVDIALKLRV